MILCGNPRSADIAAIWLEDCACLGLPLGGDPAAADLNDLRDRHVVICPDVEATGIEGALDAIGAASVRRLAPSAGSPPGWGAVDALREGWSAERFRVYVTGGAADAVDASASADDPQLPPVARLKPVVSWPWGYEMTASGLIFRPKEDGPGEKLSGPFEVHAEVRAENGTRWSLAISFRDADRHPHVVMISRADLAGGDASELRRELGGKGLMLATGRNAKERFTAALAGVTVGTRALLVDKSGWHDDGAVYAVPSHQTATGRHSGWPIIFRGEQASTTFRKRGELAAWVRDVAALATGQSRLLFALGIAFAGPLLDPLGQEPGCFNIVGASSTGKTSALRLAGSVWGGGGPIGFASTWRTTSNALEGVCAQHNDCFLGLDELGMCPPHEVDAAAYSLTGGSGKARMKSDGTSRERQRWRVMVLSTAEVTLGQRIAEGGFGKTVKAGQGVRFVDLPADAGCGFGLFDHVDGFNGAAALADAVRDRTGACYGVAGPAFIDAYLADPATADAVARHVIRDFTARQVASGASGQVHRVALRFGLVAAAGELAIAFGLIPVEAGAVVAAAGVLFRQWLDQRGGIGASEARTAVNQVRDFLHRHALARFAPAGPGLDSGSWRVQNVAGFRTGDEADGDFLFTDAGFTEATTGLDRNAAADALHAAGFLMKDPSGRRKAVQRVGGKPMRVFRVRAAILEGEE